MNWMRTAMLGALGGTLVTLLAHALNPTAPPPNRQAPAPPAVDPGTLFPDVDRLRERLRAPITPASPSRNLFTFAPEPVTAASSPFRPVDPTAEPQTPDSRISSLPQRQTPPFHIIGLAETGADGNEWTAIISGPLGPQLAKAGEVVDGWRITAVRADAVELAPLGDGAVASVVLTLE